MDISCQISVFPADNVPTSAGKKTTCPTVKLPDPGSDRGGTCDSSRQASGSVPVGVPEGCSSLLSRVVGVQFTQAELLGTCPPALYPLEQSLS